MKVAMKAATPVGGRMVKLSGIKPKAKAIADKSFAKVAAKVKTDSSHIPAGSGTWYFMKDLRKLQVGVVDEKAWQKFDAKMTKALEMAWGKGFKQYTCSFGGKDYIIKFK